MSLGSVRHSSRLVSSTVIFNLYKVIRCLQCPFSLNSLLFAPYSLDMCVEVLGDVRYCVIRFCQPRHGVIQFCRHQGPRQIFITPFPHKQRHFLHVAEHRPKKQLVVGLELVRCASHIIMMAIHGRRPVSNVNCLWNKVATFSMRAFIGGGGGGWVMNKGIKYKMYNEYLGSENHE